MHNLKMEKKDVRKINMSLAARPIITVGLKKILAPFKPMLPTNRLEIVEYPGSAYNQ
jgi:hypothetical protein